MGLAAGGTKGDLAGHATPLEEEALISVVPGGGCSICCC